MRVADLFIPAAAFICYPRRRHEPPCEPRRLGTTVAEDPTFSITTVVLPGPVSASLRAGLRLHRYSVREDLSRGDELVGEELTVFDPFGPEVRDRGIELAWGAVELSGKGQVSQGRQ